MPRSRAASTPPVLQRGVRTAASSQDPIRRVAARPATDLGRAISHPVRSLICDLVSPITVGSEPRYRLGPPDAERSPADRLHEYRWTVRGRADGRPVWQTVTEDPELRITAAAPGRYLVEVVVLADGTPTGVRLSIDHDVEVEPPALTAGLRGASSAVAQAMRELVTDLRPYILDAAAATGPSGITARCLASVLAIEILGRPKPSRERELDEIGALLGVLERGERVLFTRRTMDRPLGVGQIHPMTAAMVTGATPWIDQDAQDRRPGRDRIKANYDALLLQTKQMIFARLRWPRSNIAMAARLLSLLKNRSNRYPALTRAELASDSNAVGVVATEYAGGGTGTPAADASPSGYGGCVWQQMQEPLMQWFFPDD